LADVQDGQRLGERVGLTDERLLEMYRTIALARALDQRMWILNRAGRAAFVISGQGHEGAQVGIVAALRPGHDWMVPYYRSIAAVLAFGMSPRDIMLGQFGKAADPSSGGRQMPAHYGHAGHNILTSSSPVGTQILHATGIALAARVRGTDQVAITFMGEGSSNQGDVHEGLNFAAIHRLPMILVVENNGYSISVPAEKELAIPDVADRAAGYGIPGVVVDGADVLGAYAAARTAVERARAGEGPTLIEAKVIRLTSHSSDDQETKYRSAEDLASAKARDPLPRFREQLTEAGVLTSERERELAEEISGLVNDAADWAEAQPDPTPESGHLHVYADDSSEGSR
jgi:2-oxoisovalerate dehydrogenase E1 component alpha subunit